MKPLCLLPLLALPLAAAEHEKPAIEAEDIAHAEKIIGLEFNDKKRELMLEGVRGHRGGGGGLALAGSAVLAQGLPLTATLGALTWPLVLAWTFGVRTALGFAYDYGKGDELQRLVREAEGTLAEVDVIGVEVYRFPASASAVACRASFSARAARRASIASD